MRIYANQANFESKRIYAAGSEFCAKKRRTIREKGINNLTARQKYGMFSIDEHMAQNGKAPRIGPWATAGD
jgi:hypothetical protein